MYRVKAKTVRMKGMRAQRERREGMIMVASDWRDHEALFPCSIVVELVARGGEAPWRVAMHSRLWTLNVASLVKAAADFGGPKCDIWASFASRFKPALTGDSGKHAWDGSIHFISLPKPRF